MAPQRIQPASYLKSLDAAACVACEDINAVIEEGRKPCFYVSEGRIFERGHPLPIGLAQAREKAGIILGYAMDPDCDDDLTAAGMRRLADLVAAYREVTRTPPTAPASVMGEAA